MPLEIVTIPCLSDNYAYLLRCPTTQEVALVDAPEAEPILSALAQRGWTLSQILLTHHHPDHIDGVPALQSAHGCSVLGAIADQHRLPGLDRALAEGEQLHVGAETAMVLDVSGHTIGHIAFHFAQSAAVFSADSLMALGCGRLFEGDAAMMWASMQKFLAMPDETIVYSGHEYTQSNARFALTIEPENMALAHRSDEIDQARAKGLPTVPSQLGLEKATNPFLRAHLPEVKAALGLQDRSDAEVFRVIRARKDAF